MSDVGAKTMTEMDKLSHIGFVARMMTTTNEPLRQPRKEKLHPRMVWRVNMIDDLEQQKGSGARYGGSGHAHTLVLPNSRNKRQELKRASHGPTEFLLGKKRKHQRPKFIALPNVFEFMEVFAAAA
jgi:hypothetical protein